MKKYETFNEIEYDLKRLYLEKQIALEEIKGAKRHLETSLNPSFWVKSIAGFLGKYGFLVLIKKFFK